MKTERPPKILLLYLAAIACGGGYLAGWAWGQENVTGTSSISLSIKAFGDQFVAALYALAGVAGTVLAAWMVVKPKFDALRSAYLAATVRGDKAEVAVKATAASVAPILERMEQAERKKTCAQMKVVTEGFGADVAALVDKVAQEVKVQRASQAEVVVPVGEKSGVILKP